MVTIYNIGPIKVPQEFMTLEELMDTLQDTEKALQTLTDIVHDLIRSDVG